MCKHNTYDLPFIQAPLRKELMTLKYNLEAMNIDSMPYTLW